MKCARWAKCWACPRRSSGGIRSPARAWRCGSSATITPERLRVLRDADEIVLEELIAANLYRKTAQVFAVLLPIGTVGVMGDARSYDSVIAIRAVESQDFMTADWAQNSV